MIEQKGERQTEVLSWLTEMQKCLSTFHSGGCGFESRDGKNSKKQRAMSMNSHDNKSILKRWEILKKGELIIWSTR